MSKLTLVTTAYPYGRSEAAFVEPELACLKEHFEVAILSRNATDPQTSEVPVGIRVWRTKRGKAAFLKGIFPALTQKMLYREFRYIFRHKKEHLFHNLASAGYFMAMACVVKNSLVAMEKECGVPDILYTYWNDWSTLGAVWYIQSHNEKTIRLVTRTHGVDLYEERTPCLYQPYKVQLNQCLDRIFFISHAGMTYHEMHYGTALFEDQYQVRYMGVSADTKVQSTEESEVIRLVSCATMFELKRLDRIIDALEYLEEMVAPLGKRVIWTHIGDGPERAFLERRAQEKLDMLPHIRYIFAGNLPNEEVHRYYRENQYDLFLSVSRTEGLPVSMQEAIAHGIPVMGTDVGGCREIIEPDCGVLLDANVVPLHIAEAVMKYMEQSYERRMQIRENCVRQYKEKFDSKSNYEAFCRELEQLIN
ncbi:MAG: glycosyltransferase [Lachnospiraceae bacterium]|nr:glycosyltransferase [Lachnospiraceae bacterium]